MSIGIQIKIMSKFRISRINVKVSIRISASLTAVEAAAAQDAVERPPSNRITVICQYLPLVVFMFMAVSVSMLVSMVAFRCPHSPVATSAAANGADV